ncbi:hypothetical protein B0J11DRAFT_320622 [Dendryphion nanum]|uniref:PWWP domain-containing protein n=1 Tax=Dendryphion nanum TaxID=256645 RepID=A0A9P9IIV1_9PLEO|nr:hypothetical protein B0J11DRAFT_320622 [Dendryphion nanum]
MAEEANAPAAVEATKPTTRSIDSPEASPVVDAKSVNGGDVAAESAATEDANQTPAAEETPADKTASQAANTGDSPADNEGVAEASEEAVATNGTPAPKKGGNRRKSAASVPEHKKKTPAKKKGAATLHLDVEPGETWFVAMKGYPPWPVIICDEAMLPEALLMKRPVSARRVDGTYREDFREGGKNVKDRRYPVMFLGTNEFAWQVNTDLQPLDVDTIKHEVETGNNSKKSKALWQAYEIAAQGRDIDYFKELLSNHEQAMQADVEEKEAAAEAKQNKKAKRKSTAVEEPEDIEMEEAEDAGASSTKKPKSAKKRKAETEGEPEKPAKTPKTKLKLTAPKEASTTKSKKETKPKKTKAKSESEEAEVPKPEEKPMTESERRDKQEKSVLYLRHRLQKGFLSRDQAPKEEEMSNMDDYLRQLESTENLDADVIKKTKVHKVLKAIVKLNTSIPKEEQYDFKGRSSKLLQKWTSVLSADGETGESGAPTAESATNGVSHDSKVEATSTEEKPEIATNTIETVKSTDGDGDISMVEAKSEESAVKTDTAPSATPVDDGEIEAATS